MVSITQSSYKFKDLNTAKSHGFLNSIGMPSKLIPFTFILLMCFTLHEQRLTKRSFSHYQKTKSDSGWGLYNALVTGNKSGVPNKTIKTMKDFGLMHLLTPSGLHLSSFLLLFHWLPRFRLLIIFSLLISSFFIEGYMALHRMLIFYSLNHFLKNIKLSFLGTFFFSLLTGNYYDSPLSFCFTFIFWGAIVFNNGSKWDLAKHLFMFQSIIAILFDQQINLLAIVLNPLISGAFTVVFPFVLLCYPVPILKELGNYLVEIGHSFILLLDYFNLLNVPGVIALLLFAVVTLNKKWLLLLVGMTLSTNLTQPFLIKRSTTRALYPLPSEHEVLGVGRYRINYIDRKCRFKKSGDFKCKKKPSKFGGPSI